MDGKNLEPARIMTHFESDYGAAPKVEMRRGQITTNILPSFAADRWVGVLGEIVDAPMLDICRDQIDIRFRCDAHLLARADARIPLDDLLRRLHARNSATR